MTTPAAPVTIPIRNLMAPPDDEGVEFMSFPREVGTFEMPRLPEPGPESDVAGALAVLADFIGRFERWLAATGDAQQPQAAGAAPSRPAAWPRVDLVGLGAPTLRVLNETLGEGEVAAIVDAGHEVRIQETVFAGVWREQHYGAQGALLHDYLLGAAVPPVLLDLARQGSSPALRELPLPAGAMNVAPLVFELQDAIGRVAAGVPPHVVNLTLLPLSPADTAHLDALLAGGKVVILSRGFGNCRISSTAARHVWRVQYFNNMQTLILNTIEVVEVPEVALAAPEDLVESRGRLGELVQWMSDSLVSA